MKFSLKTTATIILLAIGFVATAQPSPAGAPPPPPHKGPKPEKAELQQITAFTGTVGSFVYNDDYVYDGFILKSSSGSDTVKFAPHMGAQIRQYVKEGSSVTVNGTVHTNPEGRKDIRVVSLVAGSQTITDTPPAPPSTAVAAESVNGSSKVSSLLKTKRGDVNGYSLADGTMLRFPPQVAEQLSDKIAVGTTIAYTGFLKAANSNEAVAKQVRIVHCNTVTVNGTQYLTR